MQVLVNLFETLNRASGVGEKAERLKRFRLKFLGQDNSWKDHYDLYRLILPNLDKDRPVYGLKETACVTFLLEAFGALIHQSRIAHSPRSAPRNVRRY